MAAQLLVQLRHAVGLELAAAVGEEDEWDVVIVQQREGLGRAGEGGFFVEEDAVDAGIIISIRDQVGGGAGGRKGLLKGKGKGRGLPF